MIKLNHTRIRQSLENVLSELDDFESQLAKPTFTVFIMDVDRHPDDPFTAHFSASVYSECPEAVEAAYFEAHNKGCGEPDFEGSTAGEFWNFKGACVIGVIAGELSVIWNPDGCGFDEYEAAFKSLNSEPLVTLDNVKLSWPDIGKGYSELAKECEGVAHKSVFPDANGDLKEMIAKLLEDARAYHNLRPNLGTATRVHEALEFLNGKPLAVNTPIKLEEQFQSGEKLIFPQTEKAVIISTLHISFGNWVTLNGLMEFDRLPWWIVATNYGYIIRFEAAVNVWEEENNIVTPDLMHPFKAVGLDDTFSALCATIAENGFDVIHLDRDAAEVAGLQTYEHE